MSLVKFITHGMPKSSLFLLFMPIFHRIFFTGNAAIRRRMVFLLKIPISFSSICHRVCLKNHSRNLHAPLCGIFHPNSVAVARYGALIRAKYPTNCDAHLAESLFQTRSRACLIIKLYTHICPLDPGLAPEVVSQGQCGLWGAHTRKVRSWQRYFLEPESVFLEHQWLCRISPWRWRRWCSER